MRRKRRATAFDCLASLPPRIGGMAISGCAGAVRSSGVLAELRPVACTSLGAWIDLHDTPKANLCTSIASVGIQDRDWYREHHRSLRQAARLRHGTAPTVRAAPVLAMLIAVLVAGCAVVAAVMAYATGRPISMVIEQAAASMAGDISGRPWIVPGAVALVAVLALAARLQGRLQMVLVWAGVACIGYAVSDALLSRQRALEVRIPGSAAVELHRSPSGHYLIGGSINGIPVRFMVDTGASVTSIPQALARRAGITACVPRAFSTAAGVANGCVGRATTLAVAGLQLAHAQVAVMPLMQDTALLGMDVLSRLHIEQRGQVMRLVPASER